MAPTLKQGILVDSNLHSDSERVSTCMSTLEQIQIFLDTTDLRFVTSEDLRDLERRISTAINEVNQVSDKNILPANSRKYILRNVRSARSELFKALDSQDYTEKDRRSFYRYLNSCQEYISEAVWRLIPIIGKGKETTMSGLEPIAVTALTKAVDFLFTQAEKLMEERRENRRKLGEEDDTPQPDSSDNAISQREELNKLQPKTIYLKDVHQEIEHCLRQIHQYRSNRRHTLDQIAHQGGINRASIESRNDLIAAENEIKKLVQELKLTIERVYGHKVRIIGLE